MIPGSIPGGVTWDFFRGSFRQNHAPWGRLSLSNVYQGFFLGLRRPVWRSGPLTYPEPLEPPRPVVGYLYYIYI